MPEVKMYCTQNCPFCQRAERLFNKKGITPVKIDVDNDADLWSEMEKQTGRDTVPQIFIGDRHVGGYDDLVELDMDDELDPLLGLE